MIIEEPNNWLQPFRDKAGGMSQDCLAKHPLINKSTKTIQRWENYESASTIPYQALATVLNTTVEALEEAYREGWDKQQKCLKHLEIQKKPINTLAIVQALNACTEMGLTDQILQQMGVEDGVEAAAQIIAGWLKKSEIQPFRDNFNHHVKAKISGLGVGQERELDLIEQLIGYIALAAIIPHGLDKPENSQLFHITDAKHAWVIRLAIDASNPYSAMTGIHATSPVRLTVKRGIKAEETTKDQLWPIVHKIVKDMSDELFMEEEQCPELVESKGFKEGQGQAKYADFSYYCQTVLDEHLKNINVEPGHWFLYSLQTEPENVRQLLADLLPNLRAFICCDSPQSVQILRLKEVELGSWIANLLSATQKRREQILHNQPIEDTKMETHNNTDAAAINIHGGFVSIANGKDSSAIQINQASESSQLVEVLKTVLAEINKAEGDYRHLRTDVENILNPLSETRQIPQESKSWLQEGLQTLKSTVNLKNGTELITAVSKAIALFEKF